MVHSVIDVYPPLNPVVVTRPRAKRLPFPLDDRRCRLYMQARQGLWWGLKGLGIRPGDEFLVPAYHHGSEIEVLVRAGVRCRFYDSCVGFEPDQSELEALLTKRVRALYIIHPLGFAQASSRWRRWCDDHDLMLLEDGAQAWLSTDDGEPVGIHADLALFCLYKAFGLPDGGAVYSREFAGEPPTVASGGMRGLGLHVAKWAAQRSGRAAALVERISQDARFELPEFDFALTAVDEQAARMTRLLLRRLVDLDAPQRRRANFRYLADALPDLRSPAFADLPSGSSPLVFPVEVDDKPALVERLRRSGIRNSQMWTVPHPVVTPDDYPGAKALRARLVGLPVHQELRREDLARIADAARGAVVARAARVAVRAG
jgi:dTDP-4-amino-4,6-dideoxygalactose transaminase